MPVVAGILLCGTAYRILAAGGAKGTPTSTSNSLHQPVADTNGLVAWYPLDGDTKDYSGNHYDGTPSGFTFDGTTNGWTGGKFGKAILLNGSNQISAPTMNLAGGVSTLSISVWVNEAVPPPYEGKYSIINTGNDNCNTRVFVLDLRGNFPQFGLCNPDGTNTGQQAVGNLQVLPGTWSFISGTFDGSTGILDVYENGRLVNSVSTGYSHAVARSSALLIGANDGGPQFNGAIDDVRVYNRVLSASEVAKLYAGTPSQNCDQTCRAWLKFDDNAGTTAKDSVGTHSGTMNGTASWTTGNFASAVQLDGSTGYVSVPDLGLSAGTADMWINPASVSGDQRLFAQASGSSAQPGQIALNQSSGENGSLWTWDGSAWQRLAPDGTVKAGQWNQIVVANNGGTATAYVNGVQQLTAVSNFAFSGVPSVIGGKFLGTAGGTFNGSVDDFRIYSRFLAPEEVADQWRQGT